MSKRKPVPTDPVAVVERIDTGDITERDAAVEELHRLLDANADLTLAAQRALEILANSSSNRWPLLRHIDRYPPADWSSRVDELFTQLKKAKSVREKEHAAELLVAIGSGDRWGRARPNLHVPDLWPRLWQFRDSPHPNIAKLIRAEIRWGLRACPDRKSAEDFLLANDLTHAAVEWAWIGEDTRALMDRIFAAHPDWRTKATEFTVVYELQHGRAKEALEWFAKLKTNDQEFQAQEFALSGKRLQPVATVIEWIGGLLDSDNSKVCYKAAWGACERAELAQDIGPILPNLGRLLDRLKLTGESRWALHWAAAALAETTKHLPHRKEAALRELTARLSGKVSARTGAGYGLVMAAALANDWDEARKWLDHADAHVCAAAIRGSYGARKHVTCRMDETRKLFAPLLPHLKKLASDPRPAVKKAADEVLKAW